ncbi:cytochrome C oxidase subunit IV family protein [Reyranella sp.]|jgi:cytochrome c oxidase subunit 4|uniref:cytochrome C oxidase subunit IV family protein n=1 Tax=Reyranella sp. TaxID=1929291 RepID=UPI002F9357C5
MSAVQWRLAGVWGALVALLSLTVGASFLLTGAASIVVSLGIAFAKAALIFWFFMQLRGEHGLIRVFAVGASVWLLILFGLASIDYATR